MTKKSKYVSLQKVANSSLEKLKKIQSGEYSIAKTGIEHFDKQLLGGFVGGEIVAVAAPPGVGKTEFLQRTMKGIFNTDINPNCLKDYVLYLNSWDMSGEKLIIRELKKEMGISITELRSYPFSSEQEELASEIIGKLSNLPCIFEEFSTEPEIFKENVLSICENYKKKEKIFVMIDHINLVKGVGKNPLDALIEVINNLVALDKRLCFLILTQANNNIFSRADERSNKSAPMQLDLYGTGTLYHLCDLVLFLMRPEKMNIENYMTFGNNAFRYLEEHTIDIPKSRTKKRTFLTKDRIFYHYIKQREEEVGRPIHVEFIENPFIQEDDSLLDLNEDYFKTVTNNFNNNPDF